MESGAAAGAGAVADVVDEEDDAEDNAVARVGGSCWWECDR